MKQHPDAQAKMGMAGSTQNTVVCCVSCHERWEKTGSESTEGAHHRDWQREGCLEEVTLAGDIEIVKYVD